MSKPKIKSGWVIVSPDGDICGSGLGAYPVWCRRDTAIEKNTYLRRGFKGYTVHRVLIMPCKKLF